MRLNISLLFLLLIITSCNNSNKKDDCLQKFLGSYVSLKTTPGPWYDNDNSSWVNMSDSARIYVNCMIKTSPNNPENYLWKAKTHFILGEYDSMIYTLQSAPDFVDKSYNYAFESLIGIGYEFSDKKENAEKHYENSLELISNYQNELPFDFAFSNFLLNNNPIKFKENLISSIEEFQNQVPNDSMYNLYLYEVNKIPYDKDRRLLIDNIVSRYDALFYQKP